MIEFQTVVDIRSREPKRPTVAKLIIDGDVYFVVIGLAHGAMRTPHGTVAKWRSASGAYRAARKWTAIHGVQS